MAFLVEAAGGVASNGQTRILTIQPKELHQRTPVFMGSPDDVTDALRFAGS
jgi:fructose-1,6-bisphosphatase I